MIEFCAYFTKYFDGVLTLSQKRPLNFVSVDVYCVEFYGKIGDYFCILKLIFKGLFYGRS